MKLVTFGIDEVQFPICVQLYTQQPLILYQIETVPVTIIDQNKQANSYTPLQIGSLYIALNSEKYISLRQQELRTCRKIGYKFYCKELFIVNHKSKYNCESVIHFDLDSDIIQENCNFAYYFNRIDTKPTVLDGGSEIILADWQDDKHIMCNVNNDIPVKYPATFCFRQQRCIVQLWNRRGK